MFSLGATEPHSRDYFFREQANFASAYIPQQLFCESYSIGEFIQAQQHKQLHNQQLQFRESEFLLARSFLQKQQGVGQFVGGRVSDARLIALVLLALVFANSSKTSGQSSEEGQQQALVAAAN